MLPEIVLVGALSGLVQGLSGFAFGLIATAVPATHTPVQPKRW
jgi:uncharacterized membrane protein YfcA